MRNGVPDRRRAILAEHGLNIAPREIQNFFWRRYNRQVRRSAVRLADAAAETMLRDAADSREVARLAEAWVSILPEALGRKTLVESFAGGRLRVVVDSAATRYVLSRQMAGALADALNDVSGGPRVERIDFRIGRIDGCRTANQTKGESD